MNVFKGFNGSNGDVCPICKNSKYIETVLIPIPGTEKDGLIEAKQIHKKCYDFYMEMNSEDQKENKKWG